MIPDPVLEPHRYTTFDAEKHFLCDLLNAARARVKFIHGAAVEIGAYKGETTEKLLQNFYLSDFHVIDPWDGTQDASDQSIYEQFLARVRPLTEFSSDPRTSKDRLPSTLTIHRQRSQDVDPPRNMWFVFHDGDHREPDFQKWYDALLPGGVLVIHDFHEPGWPKVREAAEALGRPWHEYRYAATPEEHAEYGPATRGLFWKWK